MLTIIALAYTFSDMQNLRCDDYCRYYAGYDGGYYSSFSKSCWCQDKIEAELLNEKKIIFPYKNIQRSE